MDEIVEREYVKNRLAHEFYALLCRHKGWNPGNRVDPACFDYAELVIDLFGWDDDVIARLAELQNGRVAS